MALDFRACVSTYDTFSTVKCRPLGKKMSGNNSYSLLHVSGRCADTCGKGLKRASVHTLSCQCCGLAVVLWLISARQVHSSSRDTGMARLKSSPWPEEL